MGLKEKWDNIFSQADVKNISANEVLQQNAHLLPASGRVLDLACGLGGNALLLAQAGLETYAWDISAVALSRLQSAAHEADLSISTLARDVQANPPEPDSFDVIVVGHFLYRPGFNALIDALRNNGLLFYQTFTREKVNQSGPSNPDYLLERNELLERCSGMNILVYREEGKQGDSGLGWRNQAMIVAQKTH